MSIRIRSISRNKNKKPPDGDGRTCLWWTAHHGHIESTRFIVSLIRTFDFLRIVDSTGGKEFTTPLWVASKQGHYEVVKLLHQAGANINAKSYYGDTPLHVASKYGHHKVSFNNLKYFFN